MARYDNIFVALLGVFDDGNSCKEFGLPICLWALLASRGGASVRYRSRERCGRLRLSGDGRFDWVLALLAMFCLGLGAAVLSSDCLRVLRNRVGLPSCYRSPAGLCWFSRLWRLALRGGGRPGIKGGVLRSGALWL